MALIQPDWYPHEKRTFGWRDTKDVHAEDTGRRQPPTCQGKRPPRKLTLLAPVSRTSSLQDCEMDVCP